MKDVIFIGDVQIHEIMIEMYNAYEMPNVEGIQTTILEDNIPEIGYNSEDDEEDQAYWDNQERLRITRETPRARIEEVNNFF